MDVSDIDVFLLGEFLWIFMRTNFLSPWTSRGKNTHRHVYTEEPLHTETFTHRSFYTETFLHTEALHKQKILHRDFLRSSYTGEFLHTEASTHRSFYT